MPFPASTQYPGSLVFPSGNPNWPTLVIEVEFTAGTWTAITKYVRGASAARGRQYELAQSDAGRTSLALDNSTGRFDPTNASSPYYPNVKIRKRIRCRITWAGTSKTIWTSYATKWPQDWGEAGNYQTVALEATDILGVLKGKVFAEHSVAEKITQLSSLVYWWPLQTQDSAARTPELVGGSMYGQALTFGGSAAAKAGGAAVPAASDTPPGGLEGASIAQFTPDVMGSATPTHMGMINLARIVNGQSLAFPSLPWTIGFICQSAGKPVSGGWSVLLDCIDSTGGNKQFFRLAVNSAGYAWFIAKDKNGSTISSVTGTMLADGKPHYVSLELSGGTPFFRLSVDNGGYYNFDSGNIAGWQFDNLVDLNVGGLWPRQGATGVQGTRPWSGTIGHVCLWNANYASNGVFNVPGSLPDVAVNGFWGDTTDARIQNAMTLAQRGGLFTTLDTGDAILQAAKFGGKDAAAAVLEPIPWEQGNLFVRGDGQVCFSSRSYRYNPVSAFTIGTGTSYPVASLGLDYDDTHLINSAQVSRDGGGTTIMNDSTSQSAYGLFSASGYDSEGVRDDNQCAAQAQYLVRRYKDPATRIRSVVLDCASHPALFALIVQLEIEQCVMVQHTPLAGNAITQVSWVESIQYDIAAGVFNVTLQLSPADTTGWLVADDATKGVLDTSANALSF